MPETESVYDERLTVKITSAMAADLRNVSTKSGETMSAIVRQAIRNYLDGTDLTLGTRRTFDRRVQHMFLNMEKNLKQNQEQGFQRLEQRLKESVDKELGTIEYRARKAVDAALSDLTFKVSQAVKAYLEDLGSKRRR
jgi:predicted DNA-binding protein